MKKIALVLALVALTGSLLNAQTLLIIDPLTADYSGTGVMDKGAPISLINNSGLSSALGSVGTTVAYPTTMPTQDTDESSIWRLVFTNTLSGTLTFGLNLDSATGGNAGGYDITGVYLYNYQAGYNPADNLANAARGLNVIDLKYSTDGGLTYLDYGTVTFPAGTGSSSDQGALVNLSSTLTGVTNLQFASATNHGDSTFIGADELRFVGYAAVPEPSVYMMILGGVGMLFILKGRRTRLS